MLKSCISIMLFILISIPAGVDANPKDLPKGKWWRIPTVVQRIGLTPDEIGRLDQAFFNSSREIIQLRNRVEAEQFELEVLVEAAVLEEAKVMNQHIKLETARSKLATERFRFFLEIRKIVGYDRFRQLLEIKRARLKRRK